MLLPLLGGALIGVAATLLLLTHGRIAGISGLVEGALPAGREGRSAKVDRAFVVGLLIAGAALALFAPSVFGAGSPPPLAVIAAAGVLVGVGTRLGQGCTSGHGVCGLSRLSGRSLAATLTFMATAALTVLVVRA